MWLPLCLVLLCGQASAVRLEPGVHIASKNKVLPVVLWHGMGDSCCSSYSMGAIKSLIEDKLGVFVLSVATGSTEALDVWSSYFGDVNDQVAAVCEQIRGTPELQNGYNAIGFSQGGQFIRALVQRCQHKGPKAHTVITMGAQHQGVMTIPGCEVMSPAGGVDSLHSQAACKAMQAMLSRGAYIDVVQSRVVQAQYFKDPHHLDAYLRHSIFLADINNEHEKKNEQYRSNLLSLQALVLYRFAEDKTVVPRDSSWFGFYNGTALQPLQEQALYSEDWLGLRELDEGGRLVFAEAPGGHMHFTLEWFEQVMSQYLN